MFGFFFLVKHLFILVKKHIITCLSETLVILLIMWPTKEQKVTMKKTYDEPFMSKSITIPSNLSLAITVFEYH